MDEASGWLLDVYTEENGVTLWLLTDDGRRLQLRMELEITFYAAGDFSLLRKAWIFLKEKELKLAREIRRDLFLGQRDVLAVTTTNPRGMRALTSELQHAFPDLDYYNTDLPVSLHFIAKTNVHLLGRCRVQIQRWWVKAIEPLDSPWELQPKAIPLRSLTLVPDCNPSVRAPRQLQVEHGRNRYLMPLDSPRQLLISLRSDLERIDPDLILSDYGDTWLFPQLNRWIEEIGIPFNLNRDEARTVLTKRADSYFAYGQVTYRGAQAHLFGRWHIDRKNAMSFPEYGLEGAMEQTRVTGIPVQEMARRSPGAGITAMQMLRALQDDILIPAQKQQAEGTKTLNELISADRGGLIYQPLIGLHGEVAQLDFASMYPAIMVQHNISPETKGDMDLPPGLIPRTLKPLLEKRLTLKNLLTELDPKDCRVPTLKARASALKWLLVVCFGYLGYKNARFGRIESHEAVTSISRELMLQAKETAEDLGFTVLHMYVDCLFVQQDGYRKPKDFTPLMTAIQEKTGIPIALEGVFKWVIFTASKRDARVPIPNQYFGAFLDGNLKYRGIELRRRDTPPWVLKVQLRVLEILARAEDPQGVQERIPEVLAFIEISKQQLRAGKVPLEDLVVRQRLSRELTEYRTPSAAARAAVQLQAHGRQFAPGQSVIFLYTRAGTGVHAWEQEVQPPHSHLDTKRYCHLLDRALATVLGKLRREIFELRLFT